MDGYERTGIGDDGLGGVDGSDGVVVNLIVGGQLPVRSKILYNVTLVLGSVLTKIRLS
jgi:hypothetical protein